MKNMAVPPLVTPQVEGNLSDLPVRNGRTRPHDVAFSKPSSGTWVDVTNAEFLADVRALAKGLMAAGVGPGERVAIMSKTRYEWTMTDFAVWTAGAVPVPIYETSSAEQVSWIVRDAGCAALVLETPTHAETLAEVRGDLTELRDVWQIEAGGLEELMAAGGGITDDELEARRSRISRADIATICMWQHALHYQLASVERCPFGVFFPEDRPSLSYKIVRSCGGEFRLNSSSASR